MRESPALGATLYRPLLWPVTGRNDVFSSSTVRPLGKVPGIETALATVDTILLNQSGFDQLDVCIPVLENALSRDKGFANRSDALRVCTAALGATMLRRGDQPELQRYIERLLVLMRDEEDTNLRVAAGTQILGYAANFGHLSLALRTLPMIEHMLMRTDIAPARKALCAFSVAWCYVNFPDPAKTDAWLARLEGIAAENCLPALRRFSALIGFWSERYYRHTDAMTRWLGVFEDVMNPANSCDLAHAHTLRAILHLDCGHPLRARPHALETVRLGDDQACPMQRLLGQGILAQVQIEVGEQVSALGLLDKARKLARSTRVRVYLLHALEARAWLARKEGGDRYRAQLLELFEAAQEFGSHHALRFFPGWMAVLSADALALQVCPEFVSHLVLEWNWLPPESFSMHWPWTISIKTLGTFEIKLHDGPLRATRKSPIRLLSLLKALIALGCVNVPEYKLIQAMWPDDDSDVGRGALQVALTRLRKLLGRSDAVHVKDGKVSLNSEVCWVDSMAFERLSGSVRVRSDMTLDAEHVVAADNACALYRGGFLPADTDASWALATRERLRDRQIHLIELLAAHHESRAEWTRAALLYRQGIETDQLFEKFHQGLIRCYLNAGEHAEALSTYRKMCQTLSVILGIQPSAQSQVLYRNIYQNRSHARNRAVTVRA